MSSNSSNFQCGLSIQALVVSTLPPILIIEFLLGLPGNLMALWVFCSHLRSWMPIVVFLFNLVLADFLLLVNLPFRIDYFLRSENWVFGDVCCRIHLFMVAVNRSASIAFMTAVAVDRYFKIVHPHHKVNHMSSQQAAGITCFIWTVVISLRMPLLTYNLLNRDTNVKFCRSFNSYENTPPGLLLHYIVYISEFFLCLIFLLFCSFRICCFLHRRQLDKKQKARQAIWIVLVIVGVFIICFCPGVITGLYVLYLKRQGDMDCEIFNNHSELFGVAIGFTYLNSALDPVIYGFCSSMFCDALKSTVNKLGFMELLLRRRGNTVNGSHV